MKIIGAMIAVWAIFAFGMLASGQQGNDLLPSAPVPAGNTVAMGSSSATSDSLSDATERSITSALPSPERSRASRFAWTKRHSLDLALAGSLGYDMFWTYRNMTHPLTVTFNTCDTGQAWEMTAAQCFADPNHTIGTSHSGIDPKFFSERGWTRIFGGRNVGMTIGGQTAGDALLAYVHYRLSKKGRVSRRIGTGLMVYKITGHITGAYSNITGISDMEHLFVPAGAWNVHWY